MQMNISLDKCREQCYDGASKISGAKKGVAASITKKSKGNIHILLWTRTQPGVGDTVKRSKVMRDASDTVCEMSKLIKYSRRDTVLEQLEHEMAPDISLQLHLHMVCIFRNLFDMQELARHTISF
jgi:hypothetical protein